MQTQEQESPFIRVVTWKAIREEVQGVNPTLAGIMDAIDPSDSFTLVKVRYPFGEKILDEGKLCLPNENGRAVPIRECDLPPDLKDKLAYSSIPLALTLKKACEVYMELNQRIVPINMVGQGELFGLFEALQSGALFATAPLWNLISGARSMFMLPKITDSNLHKRLFRKYKVSALVPRGLSDHQRIFKSIAQSQSAEKRWCSEVLFFTKDWLENRNDPNWLKFQNYLYQQGWQQTSSVRDHRGLSYIWNTLSNVIREKQLKPNPYHVDTIKHLMAILMGTLPGFKSADASEQVGPTRKIQDAYLETYGLKDYLPIIMHPHRLTPNDTVGSVYYSLMMPTLMDGLQQYKSTSSTVNELRNIKVVMDLLMEGLKAVDAPLPTRLLTSQYQYFHSSVEPSDDLHPIKEMPAADPRLMDLEKRYKNRVFPISGPFARGCVRVAMGS